MARDSQLRPRSFAAALAGRDQELPQAHLQAAPGQEPRQQGRRSPVQGSQSSLRSPERSEEGGLYDEFGEDALREGFDADRMRQYKAWANRQGATGGGGGGQNVPFNLEDLLRGAGAGATPTSAAGGWGTSSAICSVGARAARGGAPRAAPIKRAKSRSTFRPPCAAACSRCARATRPSPSRSASHPAPTKGASSAFRAGGTRSERRRAWRSPSHIHVRPHPYFRAREERPALDLPITPGEAYDGAKVKVPTPDGAVTLKVPPHTRRRPGRPRLKGKGVAKKKNGPHGDLYVHFRDQASRRAKIPK